jgi:hypothetical protein
MTSRPSLSAVPVTPSLSPRPLISAVHDLCVIHIFRFF